MKKAICLIMAALTCLTFAACGEPVATDPTSPAVSTTGTAATVATDSSTTATDVTSESTTVPSGTQSTTAATGSTSGTTGGSSTTSGDNPPVPTAVYNENIYEDVGEFVTVSYNPAYCTVKTECKKALGSKETITLTISMKPGYIFEGWTKEDMLGNIQIYLNNLKAKSSLTDAEKVKKARYEGYLKELCTDTTYTFTVSEDDIPENITANGRLQILANYRVTINYHPNGGKVVSGGETYTQTYPVTMVKCPSTLPEQGFFTRDGYTLVEYNTKADGTGYAVSLGSRVPMNNQPSLDLYCIWEKHTPSKDFSYTKLGKSAVITSYDGSDEKIVIPYTIDGYKVVNIAQKFLLGTDVKTVILNSEITSLDNDVFTGSEIETLVFWDSLMTVSDRCFNGVTTLKNIRINAALNLHNYYLATYTTYKLDRLVYAFANPELKKLVIYGGSGTQNGFDSKQIDEALNGEYFVVNLGSNANISSAFYFDWMEDFMGKDDRIIWAPEAGERLLGYTSMTWYTFAMNCGHYDVFKYIDVSKYSDVFNSYAQFASSHKSAQISFEYNDVHFSTYGDSTLYRAHTKEGSTYRSSYDRCAQYFGAGLYDYQAELISKLSQNGTKVYHVYAAMDGGCSEFNKDSWMTSYETKMKSQYPELIYISDYKVSLVPTKDMSDSEWHLIWSGAVARTAALVPYIKAQIDQDR